MNMLYEATSASHEDIFEVTLKRFDGYIVSQVHRVGRNYARHVHPAVLDLELDEVIQRVRIKLWQALEKRDILYPYAYIKLIINSEFIDMTRRQKLTLSLPSGDELISSEIEIVAGLMDDPAETVTQQIEASDYLKSVIQAIVALPPRQRYAVICSLKERVDDLRQLIDAFRAYKVDIQTVQWPATKAEKQLLRASLPPAKKALAKRLETRPCY